MLIIEMDNLYISEILSNCNDDVKEDKYYVSCVLNGTIISSQIYPIIFIKDNIRSISFYEQVLNNSNLYEELNIDQKILFCIGLRDLIWIINNGQIRKDKLKEITGFELEFFPFKYIC